jgi:hypothetical protein
MIPLILLRSLLIPVFARSRSSIGGNEQRQTNMPGGAGDRQ